METLLRKTFENTPSPSLHSLSLPPYRIKCVQTSGFYSIHTLGKANEDE
jgi:hypothetical protein